MRTTEPAQHETVRAVFAAIERRDARRLSELFHAAAELIWRDSLPCGAGGGTAWAETWDGPRPTATERRLDPRVVAAGDEVVVLWWQRGLSPAGERFEDPVHGLFRLREGQAQVEQDHARTPATHERRRPQGGRAALHDEAVALKGQRPQGGDPLVVLHHQRPPCRVHVHSRRAPARCGALRR